MSENDLQERKAFLAEVEECFHRGDFQTILGKAGVRLKRTPDDLDARMAICRVQIGQGRVDEARGLLEEVEEILAGLARIYASLGDLCLKKGLREEARAFFERFRILNPASGASADMSASLGVLDDLHETETGKAADDGVEAEEEEATPIPEDFFTVTLAELYIRQGHLQMAKEVLAAILKKDPQQERAADRLREVTETLSRQEAAAKAAPVIAELSRWLDHIGRLRNHAA